MVFGKIKSFLLYTLAVVLLVSVLPMSAFAAKETTALDGKIKIAHTGSKHDITVSGTTVTCIAEGGLFGSEVIDITLTNNTDVAALISFSWSASNYDSFTDPNGGSVQTGSYSATVAASGTVTFKLDAKGSIGAGTAKLVLSDLTYTEAKTSSNVKVTFDETYGSVTANGSEIASGTEQEVSLSTGISLTATPSSGSSFLGWIDTADNRIISTVASFTYEPSDDSTLKAVFVGSGAAPHFYVGGATAAKQNYHVMNLKSFTYHTVSPTYLFEDLNAAVSAAQSSSAAKYVVLANSGTLPAGTYTIPSGVTLLMPFDSSNTVYTTNAQWSTGYTKPTAYRTLTMADGAKLVVNGALSISAKHHYTDSSSAGGAPTGNVGFIKMQGSSNITVNNGGKLYAYGFITGSGTVTGNSGSTIYEILQIMDFRGGTQTTANEMKSKKIFPLSQYYLQNVEVPMTINTGCILNGYNTVYASSTAVVSDSVVFGTSSGMFRLSSGYVEKKYDGSVDQIVLDIYGDCALSSVEMDLGLATINSKDYILPINGGYQLNIRSGSVKVSEQDVLFQPGVEAYIADGCTFTVNNDAEVYVVDGDDWDNYCYVGEYCNSSGVGGPLAFAPVVYAPGRTYTRTAADMTDVSAHVLGTVSGAIYTSSGGAKIYSTGTGIFTQTATADVDVAQCIQAASSTYPTIKFTPAQLTNADGSKRTTGADTYTYSNGVWSCTNHSGPDATCTTAKVCTFCGATVEEAKGHTYGDPEYTWSEDNKTCTAIRTCTVEGCAETVDGHTETVNATISSEVKTPATCSVMGTTTYTATFAEDVTWAEAQTKDVQDIPTADHTPGAEATCTTAQTCTVCGTQIEAAKGHTWTDATCTAPKTCSACGTTEGEAVGHSYTVEVEGSRTAATCMATGSVTMKCANCSATEVQILAVDQDNHTGKNTVTGAKDATCTEAGYTGDTVCECGVTVKTGEAIPAKNHNYGETSYTWADDGKSCTAKRTCANDASHVEEAAATITSKITTPASCTVMGTTTYTATFDADWAATQTKDVQDVPVIDHTYDQQNTDDTFKQSDATCTAKATYYYSCSCGAKGTDTFEYGDKLAHSYGETQFTWNSYECSAVVKCSCGDEQNVDVTVTSEVTTTATCTVEGVKTYTATAVYGDATYVSDEHPTEKLGLNSENHVNKTEHEQTDATCTEPGYTAGTYCNDCQTWISGHEVINALEHSWTVSYEWSEDGKSCTATRACGNDVAHNETETVTASGAVKTAATCQAMGWTTYTANFGAEWAETQVKDVQDIAQLQHSYTGEIKSDGDGKDAIHSYKCVNGCNEYGAAVKHTWNGGEQTKDPACEAAGEMTYTCTAEGCGATYTEEIKATGHVNTTSKTEQNTDGKTHTTTVTCACDHVVSTTTENCIDSNNDFACDTCGGLLVNAYTDAVTLAEEHTGTRTVEGATVTLKVTGNVAFAQAQGTGAWNHWVGFKITSPVDMSKVTILRPDNATRVMADIKDGDDYAYLYWGMTNDADKKAEYEIDWNGDGTYDLTVILDASGANLLECPHSWGEGVETTPASCTEEGVMTYTCANCGATKPEVIEPTGHKNTVTINQKDATCGAEGYTGDTYCNDCKTTIAKGDVIPATGAHTYDNACDAKCNECGAERSITHAWKDATCTEPKTCSVCGATEGEATGHVNTTSSTVQNDDGSTHTTTVTCACGEVVSTTTGTCTDAGSGFCECGRVMQAEVNVENKTNKDGIWSISGNTMSVNHDLACVVLVEESDGTYTRLNATANANGGYDFDVKGVGNKKVVIAVKGDFNADGVVNSTDAFQIQRAEVGLRSITEIQKLAADINKDGLANSTDAFQIQRAEVGLRVFNWN